MKLRRSVILQLLILSFYCYHQCLRNHVQGVRLSCFKVIYVHTNIFVKYGLKDRKLLAVTVTKPATFGFQIQLTLIVNLFKRWGVTQVMAACFFLGYLFRLLKCGSWASCLHYEHSTRKGSLSNIFSMLTSGPSVSYVKLWKGCFCENHKI